MVQLSDPYTWWSAAVWAPAASSALAAAGAAFALTRRLVRRAALQRRDARRAGYRAIVDDLSDARLDVPTVPAELPAAVLTDHVFLACLAEAFDNASPDLRTRLIAHCGRFGYGERFRVLTRSLWGWRRMDAARWLGRLGDRDALGDLIRLTVDRSARVRSAAVGALGALPDPDSLAALVACLDEIGSGAIRRGVPSDVVTSALVGQGAEAVPALLPRMQSRSGVGRKIVVEVLACAPESDPRVRGALLSALEDRDAEVRAAAAKAIGHVRDTSAVALLAKSLSDPVWFVRLQAARALGTLAHQRAVRPLVAALTDESWQVRAAAADALRRLGEPAVPALTECLFTSRDRYVKEQVVEELQRTPFLHEQVEALDSQAPGAVFAAQRFLREVARHGATTVLLDALRSHRRVSVRRRLALALGAVDVPRVIAVLHDLAEHDRDAGVREAARRALTGRSDLAAGGPTPLEQAA
jgi:HEAT repeat protein